ncbi:MAG: hypothetical protein DME26_10875 [Verrucomicrobia bacterium]|nr:MAG: hypothetical protein DME26_10875 [Verrucomicrobiota bacterium]
MPEGACRWLDRACTFKRRGREDCAGKNRIPFISAATWLGLPLDIMPALSIHNSDRVQTGYIQPL